jgi:flagellar hook-basal body protein
VLTVSGATLGRIGSGFSVPITASNGGVSALNLPAMTKGTGYGATTYTNVELTGGSGTGARANITVAANGSVIGATLTQRGNGYQEGDLLGAPTSIGINGTGFSIPVVSVSTNRVGVFGGITPGSGYGSRSYSNVALTSEGDGTGATANITVSAAGVVTSATIANPGIGYAAGDVLTLVSAASIGNIEGSGFGLTVGTIDSEGEITSTTPLPVTYLNVVLTTDGNGEGATADITVNGTGVVTDVVMVSYGTGYAVGDSLEVAASAIGDGDGSGFGLTVASVTSQGVIGNTTPAPVTYRNVELTTDGDGEGATANITVSGAGVVTDVEMVSPGTGYAVGDILEVNAADIGDGAGSGFALMVGAIENTGAIASKTPIPRTYSEVALTTDGNGEGATANITVNGAGEVTDVELVSLGTGYAVGDILGVNRLAIGISGGSGFGLTVASIGVGGVIDDTTTVERTYSSVALTTDGEGEGATANITVNADGDVTDVELVSFGTGYAEGDTLRVLASNIGDGAGSGFGLTVATIGAGGAVGLTTTIARTYMGVALTNVDGTGSDATANITVNADGDVTNVVMVSYGTGYAEGDILSVLASAIGDGEGSGLELTVGALDPDDEFTVTIEKIYEGIELIGGAGNGATANITVNADGEVTEVDLVSFGAGYDVDDILEVDPADIGNADGTGFAITVEGIDIGLIEDTTIADGGSGYLAADSGETIEYVDVPLTGGSGIGAIATIVVDENGEVITATITAAGTGYEADDILSVADAEIGGGGGSGFELTVDGVDGVVGEINDRAFEAGSGYSEAMGYLHATTGTGYLHATTGTGYVQALTGTGYVHGLTGTGYTHGFTGEGYEGELIFEDVELTGGAGTGARATITLNSSGQVIDVTLVTGGSGYAADDVLTVSGEALGREGAGFQVQIASLKAGIKTLQNISGVTSGGTGYIDGIYKDVPLTGGAGIGAKATVEISNGVVNNVILTNGGSGYLTTDILSINTSSVGGGTGSGFTTAIGSTNTLQGSGPGTRGATYNLRLSDGTNLSLTQVSESGNGTPKYTVNVDRYSVFATLDGNAVGSNAAGRGMSTIKIGGVLTEEQTSLGTMAFVGGKNLDSLSRDAFGNPQFDTRFTIDASGGKGTGWGQTTNGGVVQFTLNSTDMTAYSSSAQAYKNVQDGSATSQLASFSVDSSGQLVAQYDNGQSVVKGQVILAYFNNQEGLIPNGNNTFEASSESGEALLSFPGDGTLGSIRSKALEQSNVDLTSELVKLMVLQRQYSAVSQATKVMASTLIDEAINIGR